MNNVLHGLKVLDCSSVLAGPLTGSFLAELGAHVTKVEAPSGDVTRTWLARGEARQGTSAYYEAANEGKHVVRKDLKSLEGREWLEHELADADVLIQNFKARDLDAMGLNPESLARRHPHVVHVRLVGFEHLPERLAYDVVVQAEAGFMSMNGHPDRPPARLPVALMDVMASHQMRSAVLGGLYERATTGKGPYAEVSLFGSGLTALANQGTAVLMNETTPLRQGSSHPSIAPYGDLLQTATGDLVIAVGSDHQFGALCEVLGLARLVTDERFATNPMRVTHRERLLDELNGVTQGIERTSLLAALHEARVPAGAVLTVTEALADPHVKAHYVVGDQGLEKLRTSAIEFRRFD